MRRVGEVNNVRRINAMIVPFVSKTLQNVADRKALLDCGASENFIDINTGKSLKIERFKFEKHIPVHNIDRTMNNQGGITYYCWLKVRVGEPEEKMRFYLTRLEKSALSWDTCSSRPKVN